MIRIGIKDASVYEPWYHDCCLLFDYTGDPTMYLVSALCVRDQTTSYTPNPTPLISFTSLDPRCLQIDVPFSRMAQRTSLLKIIPSQSKLTSMRCKLGHSSNNCWNMTQSSGSISCHDNPKYELATSRTNTWRHERPWRNCSCHNIPIVLVSASIRK